METMSSVTLELSRERLTVLVQVLESEQARLLVEIRHTDHRSYRDQLRHRLDAIEQLIDSCRSV